MLKRLVAASAATMLLAAACTPAATSTPAATAVVNSPMPTLPTSGTPLGTEMMTPEGTAMSTEMVTPAGTEMTTPMGTEMTTPMGTEMTTPMGTEMPAMTGTPNAMNEPAVLLSSELVGSTVVDSNNAEVGTVQELLVDDQGAIQYVIIDATDYMNGRVTSDQATPMATAEPAATDTMMDEGIVAVPMMDLTINAAATDDTDSQVLLYNGTADDLHSMGGFDTALLDQDGFLIDTTDSQVAADMTYDGLIRVSKFGDFNLQNAEGDDLGEVEDLVVNVSQGQVTYGVVDFGGFLGIGETSTAVPWDQFTINRQSDTPGFRLDVTSDQLENAPSIDTSAWPDWPERIEGQGDWNMDWDNQIHTFWSGAASQ
jgi:sporulation protein YlmC with PRC-barrel domain